MSFFSPLFLLLILKELRGLVLLLTYSLLLEEGVKLILYGN